MLVQIRTLNMINSKFIVEVECLKLMGSWQTYRSGNIRQNHFFLLPTFQHTLPAASISVKKLLFQRCFFNRFRSTKWIIRWAWYQTGQPSWSANWCLTFWAYSGFTHCFQKNCFDLIFQNNEQIQKMSKCWASDTRPILCHAQRLIYSAERNFCF